MNSKAHRNAIQKVLDEAYVQPDVTPEKVINMINVAKMASSISFYEDEVATAAKKQSALHITLKCYGYVIAKVLIDGGSALNVLPKTTLEQLLVDASAIQESEMIIRAFDGTRREVCGTVVLLLKIGPSLFSVEFQVMDIDPAYTMLLGRPWIHDAKVVPSTLHQRVKYISNGRLVTVKGDKELIISKPSAMPYIEAAEEVPGISFQSFEVGAIKGYGHGILNIATKVMERSRYQIRKGLRSHIQGITNPIMLPDNIKRYGLGYEPTLEEELMKRASLRKKKGGKNLKIPHIKETFPRLAAIIHVREVAVIENEPVASSVLIHRSETPLCNWYFKELPDVVSLE